MKTTQDAEQLVRETVSRARAAQHEWAERSYRERAQALKLVHYRLAERAEELADAMLADVGKTAMTGLAFDVLPALDLMKKLIARGAKELKPTGAGTCLAQFYLGMRKAQISANPYGVVGLIGTWDYPISGHIEVITAALLAGNSVVWKPSEFTPRTIEVMKHVFEALPRDLVCLLEGGADVGEALSKAAIDKLVFRGSTQTGRRVMAQAANRATPTALEMGGKDAIILHEGTSIETAVRAIVWSSLHNSGQTPFKPQRIFAHGSIYNDVRDALVAEIGKVTYGPADQERTTYAPQFNDALARFAQQMVQDAVAMGARLLVGGNTVREHKGTHMEPTLLEGVSEKMRLDTMDIWAPVLTLRKFDNDLQPVRWVNEHHLAFSVSLWGKDVKVLDKLAKQFDVAVVNINELMVAPFDACLPMSGHRLSGSAVRHTSVTVREMTRPMAITHPRKFVKPMWQQRVLRHRWMVMMLIAFKAGQYKRVLNFWQKH